MGKSAKLITLILASSFVSVFGALQLVKAAAATLYLSPASSSVQQGNNISIAIRVNPGGDPVNAAQANLSYPTDKLNFVSITSSSAFPFEVESSGGSGSVRIARGNISSVSGDQLVATVTFSAKTTTGTAAITFASGSSIIRSTDYQDILSGTTGGNYTVTAPPTPTPSPTPSPSPSSPKPASGPSSASTSVTPAVAKDATAPKISDVKAVDIAYKTVVITWTTSEPASSIVSYGVTASYGLSAIDGNFVTNHRVTLPADALASGTKFNFMVKSVDPAGNAATGNNGTFTTKGLTLRVIIVDQKGQAVKGALATLGSRSALSDKQGHATLTELPSGKHQLTVKARGKITTVMVTILDNENTKLQTVTVKAEVGGLALYVLIPLILGGIILLAVVVGILFIRFIRGGGGRGTLTPGPTAGSTNISTGPLFNPPKIVRPTDKEDPL